MCELFAVLERRSVAFARSLKSFVCMYFVVLVKMMMMGRTKASA